MTEALIRREHHALIGHGEAVFNEAGTHRYLLGRRWGDWDGPIAVFVMLNPSTATEQVKDPTVGRCIDFAIREGMAGLFVLNLFAWRAAKPRDLFRAGDQAVGERNDEFIRDYCTPGRLVIAAWGVHGIHQDRAETVTGMLTKAGTDLHCLGLTAGGQPRHPLFVRGDTPLMPYRLATAGAA